MPLKSGSQALPFDPVRVGQRFEDERERLLLSRAELAATCDYSSEQVRRVERGEQAPGARLLAALAAAGGDVGLILTGDMGQQLNDADEIYYAEYRDRVRREARDHSRLRADRRKKVLTEDEADLVEAYRDLSRRDRERALESVFALERGDASELSVSGHQVSADRGGVAAVGDVNIGHKSGRRNK